MKQVMNVETGEIELVELSDIEKEMQEKYRLSDEKMKQEIELQKQARVELLARLGLTEEQVALLFG